MKLSKAVKGFTTGIVGVAVVVGGISIGSMFNPEKSTLETMQQIAGINRFVNPYPYASSTFSEFKAPEITLEELDDYYQMLEEKIDFYDNQLKAQGLTPSLYINERKYQERLFSKLDLNQNSLIFNNEGFEVTMTEYTEELNNERKSLEDVTDPEERDFKLGLIEILEEQIDHYNGLLGTLRNNGINPDYVKRVSITQEQVDEQQIEIMGILSSLYSLPGQTPIVGLSALDNRVESNGGVVFELGTTQTAELYNGGKREIEVYDFSTPTGAYLPLAHGLSHWLQHTSNERDGMNIEFNETNAQLFSYNIASIAAERGNIIGGFALARALQNNIYYLMSYVYAEQGGGWPLDDKEPAHYASPSAPDYQNMLKYSILPAQVIISAQKSGNPIWQTSVGNLDLQPVLDFIN
jgi:hypothetical protein